jgi:glycosyltransferase involved in cell wall biosynthesis/peptidoglycan/xylan/chitin deacetylase (PgdA/CDA1 family)
LKPDRRSPSASADYPPLIELSVIIPTFNRARTLRRCLAALEHQTAPPGSFELIVVDDGSSDKTPAFLAGYHPPFELRVERQENRGQCAALNKGIELATGRFCLFLDDDIVADPELVAEHLDAQRRQPAVAVGALRVRVRKRGGLTRHFTRWWGEHYQRLESGAREIDFWSCYSGNLSAPTDALRAVGGLDGRLSRSFDVELGYRLERQGLPIVFLSQASGEQDYGKGFRQVVRDFDSMGESAALLLRLHPEMPISPPLGDFDRGAFKSGLALRLLLALRAPVWPLGLVDPLLARHPPARLYAFLQHYCLWRSARRALRDDPETWRRLRRGTVVLMYHAIGREGERASRYVLPLERFRRQLAWLVRHRYPVLDLDEYVRQRKRGTLPPAKAVVVTFDDGYADTAELAAPALLERGLPATVFLVSGEIGGVNSWTTTGPLAGRPLLSWEDARRLAEEGLAIGAHTVSHASLTALEPAAARRELIECRNELERRLERPVRHFAYPYGKRSPELEELATEAGFSSALGIEPGPNGASVPLFALRRVEIGGRQSLARFALQVWLGHPLRPPRGE